MTTRKPTLSKPASKAKQAEQDATAQRVRGWTDASGLYAKGPPKPARKKASR